MFKGIERGRGLMELGREQSNVKDMPISLYKFSLLWKCCNTCNQRVRMDPLVHFQLRPKGESNEYKKILYIGSPLRVEKLY